MASKKIGGKARVKWNASAVLRLTRAEVFTLVASGAQLVRSNWVRRLNRGQAQRTAASGLRVGLDPSKEGESPKRVSSRLIQSATVQVVKLRRGALARIGTNVSYFRRLELGFKGTDSLGRNVSQGARPSIRPALKSQRRVLRKLFRASQGSRRRGGTA